jgi:uncharacterized membrane protein
MVTIESAILAVHVVAGFVALGAGAGAIVTKKGGRRHRLLGRTYVYGMAVVSATALGLLVLEQSLGRIFLGLIAVFSFYFAFSGFRVLSRKRTIGSPGTIDWIAVALFGTSGFGLLGAGIWWVSIGESFGVVMLVFGVIASVTTVQDVRLLRATELDARWWFFEHLQRMGAAYIATVTAFAAVNATFLPTIARWLLPGILGGAAIWHVTRQYKEKFDGDTGLDPAD